MPELPEVERSKNYLIPYIGKTIIKVDIVNNIYFYKFLK